MKVVHLDFETRSEVDLKKQGLNKYAKGIYTDILCAAYAFGDDEVELWTSSDGHDPLTLIEHVRVGGIVAAHNAAFELAIWNNIGIAYGWPILKPEQVYCTMAKCMAMSLPASLDKASEALGLNEKKDMKARRIMLQLSKPRGLDENNIPYFWEEQDFPHKFDTLYQYCKNDVEVERAIDKETRGLSEKESKVWQIDYTINQRGVYLDIPSVKTALSIIDLEKKRLNKEMAKATDFKVLSCSKVADLKHWLWDQGIRCDSVDKTVIGQLLGESSTPPHCIPVLKLRQAAGKTSTAKLEAMVNKADKDFRARNTMQYHAASTGRWGGRGIQVQNLPRPHLEQKEIESLYKYFSYPPREALETIDMFYGSPVKVISSCLRSFICAPPHKTLIAGDWSAIEARGLAWLAGEKRVLDIFKADGKIYEAEAAGIYSVHIDEVDKDQRQIGKVAVLALGYQGGVKAFQSMAKIYGIKISDAQADSIKERWRSNNPNIVRFWYDLEKAAHTALNCPETIVNVNTIKYLFKHNHLWCLLPSGRMLCYPFAQIKTIVTPWGEDKLAVTFMNVDSYTKKWIRKPVYGGFLAENITQAVCRDLLAEVLIRLEDTKYKTVMHVHDEVVCEVDEGDADLKEFNSILEEVPSWAKELPLKAESWIGKRFRK